MTKKITVIGGGLAGLTAATTAARSGATVTLHEARSSVGGRARTREEDGFLLNEGAHALYAGLAGIGVLRGLGIEPKGRPPATRGAQGRLRGSIGLLPGTPMEALRSRLVGVRTKAQLGRRLVRPEPLLRRPTAGLSMAEWIDDLVTDPDARLVARMISRVAAYTGELETLAAEAAVPQVVSAMTAGVLYLDGGWQQLTNALTNVASAAGVTIILDSKIESIDDVRGADAVIFAAGGPMQAADFLRGRSATVAGWAAEEKAVRVATLDLGLRKLPRPDRRVVFGVDEPLYLSAHTPSAALAPSGGEVVHVIRYAQGDDSREAMESLLDDAQPGWRDEVVVARFSRSLTVAHGRPTPAGGLKGRPGPEVPDYEGVYVAGDWVGPVGLIGDAALASGRQAALLASMGGARRVDESA